MAFRIHSDSGVTRVGAELAREGVVSVDTFFD